MNNVVVTKMTLFEACINRDVGVYKTEEGMYIRYLS